MQPTIEQALQATITYWENMKKSSEDHAEEDANLFEASFYDLMDKVRKWLLTLEEKPKSLDDALRLPEIEQVISALPAEIYLNFETELDLIMEGKIQEEDADYD